MKICVSVPADIVGWVFDLGYGDGEVNSCGQIRGELGNTVAVLTLRVLREYHRTRSKMVG